MSELYGLRSLLKIDLEKNVRDNGNRLPIQEVCCADSSFKLFSLFHATNLVYI